MSNHSYDWKSFQRVIKIFELLDQYEFITIELAEDLGFSRSNIYRYLNALIEAGLLHRKRAGIYVAGPRYNPVSPTLKFDRASRVKGEIEQIKRMMDGPRRPNGRKPSLLWVSKEMGISYPRVLKLMEANRDR